MDIEVERWGAEKAHLLLFKLAASYSKEDALSSFTNMKRAIIFVLIVIILAVAASYLLIPGKKHISKALVIGATITASNRLLQENRNWQKWWPSKTAHKDTLYYRNFSFYPGTNQSSKYPVLIRNEKVALNSVLHLMPVGDSTELLWETSMQMGEDPLSRIRNYLHARRLSKNLNDLSLSLKNYLEDSENIYGFKIERAKIPSAYLVAVNASFSRYPRASEIYAHINQIKNYVETTEGRVTGDPMLNVTELGNRTYQAMIGMPVDREVPVQGKWFIKRIVTTDVLTTKVKGGTATTRQALTALYHYQHDYKLVSPSTPFETLLTDRTSEQDTAKWETKIFLPVSHPGG